MTVTPELWLSHAACCPCTLATAIQPAVNLVGGVTVTCRVGATRACVVAVVLAEPP
jgi:hypothetical protein